MQLFVYILFKNCNNVSLNSSGPYLYDSELMLSPPGLLPFSINLNGFLIHLMLLTYLSNYLNSILIPVHVHFLSSVILHCNEEIYFHLCFHGLLLFPLYPCLHVIIFCTLQSYMSSCSKFVTNLSQESLYLFWPLLFFFILSSNFSEANHFLYDFFLLLPIVLYGHHILLNIYFCFISS